MNILELKVEEELIQLSINANKYRKPISFTDFTKYCDACGGDWSNMLLTGIKKLYPDFYAIIPNNLLLSFFQLAELLMVLGVDFDK